MLQKPPEQQPSDDPGFIKAARSRLWLCAHAGMMVCPVVVVGGVSYVSAAAGEIQTKVQFSQLLSVDKPSNLHLFQSLLLAPCICGPFEPGPSCLRSQPHCILQRREGANLAQFRLSDRGHGAHGPSDERVGEFLISQQNLSVFFGTSSGQAPVCVCDVRCEAMWLLT